MLIVLNAIFKQNCSDYEARQIISLHGRTQIELTLPNLFRAMNDKS